MTEQERIQQMMDHIDPALVEDVDLTGKKRRPSFPLRAGLIAACVCVALVGSAFTATLHGVFVGKPVQDVSYGVTSNGFELLTEGMTVFPRDAFRAEFWEKVGENEALCMTQDPENGRIDVPLRYASLGAIQEDMGISLVENEMLNQMLLSECSIHGSGEPHFLITAVYVEGNNMRVSLNANLFVEELSSNVITLLWEPPYEVVSVTSYVMPDSSTAVIQEVRLIDPYDRDIRPTENLLDSYIYRAYFIQDGLLYSVEVMNKGDYLEEGRELLEHILNSFT